MSRPPFSSSPFPPPISSNNGQAPRRMVPYQRPTGAATGPAQLPAPPASFPDINQLLSEIRRGLDEQRKVKEDVRRVGLAMNRIEESVKQLGEDFRRHSEQSFAIETSPYKDSLLYEISILYCKSLKRLPEREEIGRCIVKVLQEDAKIKSKFNKARTFCSNRLIELRSEERRRIFGNLPCGVFPSLTTVEFAERFMNTIKAPAQCKDSYVKHLALLRKFTRECADDAASDTFKRFRDWLDRTYALGFPGEEEWEIILRADREWEYNPVETSTVNEGYVDQYSHYSGHVGNEQEIPNEDDMV